MSDHIDELPLPDLGLSMVCLARADAPSLSQYEDLIRGRLTRVRTAADVSNFAARGLHQFIQVTQARFPWVRTTLQADLLSSGLSSLIRHGGGYAPVVATLAELVDGRGDWLEALTEVNEESIVSLFEYTLGAPESLDAALRPLGLLRRRNEQFCGAFEALIGPSSDLFRTNRNRGMRFGV